MRRSTATHKGSGNFTINSLDNGNQDVDLLVNDIGNYSGTTFIAANLWRAPDEAQDRR